MRVSISVNPWICLLSALMLLIVPLPWLFAAALAALIHEGFHILAIFLCGNRVLGVRISLGGTAIETDVTDNLRELLCAMAGPIGSILLLTFCHSFPELALCAGVQGIFNLLPIYPLDGGRSLLCLLKIMAPQKADQIANWIAWTVFILLTALCIIATIRLSLGLFPIILAIILFLRAFLRKRPCKQRQIRVQ